MFSKTAKRYIQYIFLCYYCQKLVVLCRVLRMRWDIAPLLHTGIRFNEDNAMLAFERVPIFQTMTLSRFSHSLFSEPS